MADHLNNEKEEYEKLQKERQRQLEEEKEKQRKKIQLMMENGDFVKNQIQEKAEKDKILMKEKYEEGRKLKQLHDAYYNSIEMIKQQKIAELRALNIKDKYILPVEKYKVIKKGK